MKIHHNFLFYFIIDELMLFLFGLKDKLLLFRFCLAQKTKHD